MSLGRENELLLELLGVALRDEPLARTVVLFPGEWQRLSSLARMQAVSGVVFDKILSLPEGSLPPMAFSLQMYSYIEQIKVRNRQLLEALGELKAAYDGQGLPFVLVKGLAVGANYPTPMLRIPGDLDLFFYKKGDYERANLWVHNEGYSYHVDEVKEQHRAFDYGDVVVENHGRLTFFDSRRYDEAFQSFVDEVERNGSWDSLDLGGVEVQTLPLELDALYVFVHMFHHWIHSGVGLRQYSDWLMIFYSKGNLIDRKKFQEMARALDLLNVMQLFARAAVDYMGFPEDIFPFDLPKSSRKSRRIMEDVLAMGNFGALDDTDFGLGWSGRFSKWVHYTRRALSFSSITPHHAWRTPWSMIYHRFRLTLKGYK